jgi:hypothetical protein
MPFSLLPELCHIDKEEGNRLAFASFGNMFGDEHWLDPMEGKEGIEVECHTEGEEPMMAVEMKWMEALALA